MIPTARVWLARDLKAKPFLETSAKIERIGVPGGAEADATHIYVAKADAPRAGHVLVAGRARGRPEGPGDRQRRRRGGPSGARAGRAGSGVRDAHARVGERGRLQADDAGPARRDAAPALRRRVRSRRTSRSSSPSRRRSSARAGPAVRWWTSSRRPRAASRIATSASSTSRSTRGTIRRRATTAGCGSGRSRPSRGPSSSGPTGWSSSASRGRSPCASWRPWSLPGRCVDAATRRAQWRTGATARCAIGGEARLRRRRRGAR